MGTQSRLCYPTCLRYRHVALPNVESPQSRLSYLCLPPGRFSFGYVLWLPYRVSLRLVSGPFFTELSLTVGRSTQYGSDHFPGGFCSEEREDSATDVWCDPRVQGPARARTVLPRTCVAINIYLPIIRISSWRG